MATPFSGEIESSRKGELEMEVIEDEDVEEGEREYERIWGTANADEEVGEGGKRKRSSEKEENGKARKRRKLEKGENKEVWEMKERFWWRWGTVVS